MKRSITPAEHARRLQQSARDRNLTDLDNMSNNDYDEPDDDYDEPDDDDDDDDIDDDIDDDGIPTVVALEDGQQIRDQLLELIKGETQQFALGWQVLSSTGESVTLSLAVPGGTLIRIVSWIDGDIVQFDPILLPG